MVFVDSSVQELSLWTRIVSTIWHLSDAFEKDLAAICCYSSQGSRFTFRLSQGKTVRLSQSKQASMNNSCCNDSLGLDHIVTRAQSRVGQSKIKNTLLKAKAANSGKSKHNVRSEPFHEKEKGATAGQTSGSCIAACDEQTGVLTDDPFEFSSHPTPRVCQSSKSYNRQRRSLDYGLFADPEEMGENMLHAANKTTGNNECLAPLRGKRKWKSDGADGSDSLISSVSAKIRVSVEMSANEVRRCAAKLSEAEEYDLIVSQQTQQNISARRLQSRPVTAHQNNGESTSIVANNSDVTPAGSVVLASRNSIDDQSLITEDTECYDYELLVNTKFQEISSVCNADDTGSTGLCTREASECSTSSVKSGLNLTVNDGTSLVTKSDYPHAARVDSTVEESTCRFNFVVPVTPVRKKPKSFKSTESPLWNLKQNQSDDLCNSKTSSSICGETVSFQHSPELVKNLLPCSGDYQPEEINSHNCCVSDSTTADSELTTVEDTLPLLSQYSNSCIPESSDELPVGYTQGKANCDSKVRMGHNAVRSAHNNLHSVTIGQKALGSASKSSRKLRALVDQDLNSSGMFFTAWATSYSYCSF